MSMNKKMKRNLRSIVLLMTASVLLAGCAREIQYEVANYQGELAEGETKSDFDKELFYRNDQQTFGADPFVFNNTERDGYYYLYVTKGSLFCYRSTNLMDWEAVGNTLDNMKYDSEGKVTEFRNATNNDIWAPEVVYDANTELYYMFFSATPNPDNTVAKTIKGTANYMLMVATSKYPDRGYTLVNFAKLHTYDTSKYPQYYAKYSYFDPGKLMEKCKEDKKYTTERAGYLPAIDPHPYEDESGKYLFWVDQDHDDRICAIKMLQDNWLTPDWSTFTVVAYAGYSTADKTETIIYDQKGTTGEFINEGPEVLKHNGKYYLTYSTGAFGDDSYRVAQAVADPDENGGPLGSYRKLTEAEGGILLSGETSGSLEVSGTGHHSIVTVGEKVYFVYHKHDDAKVGGSDRHHCIDEIKWITIKDKDGNDLDVMYANGPTCTVQPRLEAYSKYKNIAEKATVSVVGDTKAVDVSCLTDGLLSIYKYGHENFMQYIGETNISEKTTFTFDFDKTRQVRAIMVYNSKWHTSAFHNISEVKFICEENGEEIIRYIDNLELSSEYCQKNGLDGSLFYITPGAATYAEFEQLNVKSIEITVEVPKGQENVGISEIRILGK